MSDQTIRRKGKVQVHKYHVYTFPKGKQSTIYMTQFVLAGSQRMFVDDNTNHRGERMVFLMMSPINTWKMSKVDEEHDTLCRAVSEEAVG